MPKDRLPYGLAIYGHYADSLTRSTAPALVRTNPFMSLKVCRNERCFLYSFGEPIGHGFCKIDIKRLSHHYLPCNKSLTTWQGMPYTRAYSVKLIPFYKHLFRFVWSF